RNIHKKNKKQWHTSIKKSIIFLGTCSGVSEPVPDEKNLKSYLLVSFFYIDSYLFSIFNFIFTEQSDVLLENGRIKSSLVYFRDILEGFNRSHIMSSYKHR